MMVRSGTPGVMVVSRDGDLLCSQPRPSPQGHIPNQIHSHRNENDLAQWNIR